MLSILSRINFDPENEITKILAGLLILPELNILSSFNTRDRLSTITNNSNLKLHTLTTEIFSDTVKEFKELYSAVKNTLGEYSRRSDLMMSEKNINFFTRASARTCYISKLNINDNDTVCLIGDVHGSVHSIVRTILRLIKLGYISHDYKFHNNFYLIFLGDLVDRTIYSVEVIFLIMKLKLINKENLIIIKGNHDDCKISYNYRLLDEFKKLNGSDNQDDNTTYIEYCNLMSYLPVSIFLKIGKSDYIQLTHGGFYSQLHIIKNFLMSDDEDLTLSGEDIKDFQWSIFSGKDITYEIGVKNGDNRYYSYGDAQSYFNYSGLRALIRGHEDMYDSTKLFTRDGKLTKAEKIKNRILPTDNISSFTIPIPNECSDIDSYEKTLYFLPIITLTSGNPARLVDSDGFGLLKTSNLDHIASGGMCEKYLDAKR